MIFTREQIEEIRRRLKVFGSKDTEFPLAHVPLTGEEFLAIVQDGINKRATIAALYFGFNQYLEALRNELYDYINAVIEINGLRTPDGDAIKIISENESNHFTIKRSSAVIKKGDTGITLTLEPDTGYYFSTSDISNISVSMEDDDLEGNIDINGGKDNKIVISVAKVTGDITIVATATAIRYNVTLISTNGHWVDEEEGTVEEVSHEYGSTPKTYTFIKNSNVEFEDEDNKFEFNYDDIPSTTTPPEGLTINGNSITVGNITSAVGVTPKVTAISNAVIVNSTSFPDVQVFEYDGEEVGQEIEAIGNEFTVNIGEQYFIAVFNDNNDYRVSEAPTYIINGNSTAIQLNTTNNKYEAVITISSNSDIIINGEVTEKPKIIFGSPWSGLKAYYDNNGTQTEITSSNNHVEYELESLKLVVKIINGYAPNPPKYKIGASSAVEFTKNTTNNWYEATISNITANITLTGSTTIENRAFWGLSTVVVDGTGEDTQAKVNALSSSDIDINNVVSTDINNRTTINTSNTQYNSYFIIYPQGNKVPSIVGGSIGNPVDLDSNGKFRISQVELTYNGTTYTAWMYNNKTGGNSNVRVYFGVTQ